MVKSSTPAAPTGTARKNYVELARQRIHKPSDATVPPRLLVYGRNKQGKTRFCATAPNVLVLDPEQGTSGEAALNPDVWPINEWADVNDAFRYLQTGEHSYQWVAVDGLTRIANMALRYVMKLQEERDLDRIPGQVQQRDYGRSGELMKGMLFNMQSLPLGIIYTAQERMEQSGGFDSEDEDDVENAEVRFVPDLPRGVRGSVNGIVDVIGRIYTVPVTGTRNGKEVKGRQRRLWLAPTDKFDTGFRSSVKGTPDYLKGPTVTRLVDLLNTGKVN